MIGLQIVKIFYKNYQAVLNKNGNHSSRIQANQILLSLKKSGTIIVPFSASSMWCACLLGS